MIDPIQSRTTQTMSPEPPRFVTDKAAAPPQGPRGQLRPPVLVVLREINRVIGMIERGGGTEGWIGHLQKLADRLITTGDWEGAAKSLDHFNEVLRAFSGNVGRNYPPYGVVRLPASRPSGNG